MLTHPTTNKPLTLSQARILGRVMAAVAGATDAPVTLTTAPDRALVVGWGTADRLTVTPHGGATYQTPHAADRTGRAAVRAAAVRAGWHVRQTATDTPPARQLPLDTRPPTSGPVVDRPLLGTVGQRWPHVAALLSLAPQAATWCLSALGASVPDVLGWADVQAASWRNLAQSLARCDDDKAQRLALTFCPHLAAVLQAATIAYHTGGVPSGSSVRHMADVLSGVSR